LSAIICIKTNINMRTIQDTNMLTTQQIIFLAEEKRRRLFIIDSIFKGGSFDGEHLSAKTHVKLGEEECRIMDWFFDIRMMYPHLKAHFKY